MIKWLKSYFNPEPDLYAVPDMTGMNVGMDYWICALGKNKRMPRVGDVVAKLTTCGMGMTVRYDKRYRVKSVRTPYPTSVIGERENELTDVLYIHNMRPHTTIPRFWILQD